MTAINKTTVLKNIYKNLYDLIVAISGFSTIVYPTFPDKVFNSKSDYPIIIINSPDVSWDNFTLGKSVLEGTITIDIYTNTASETDTKSDSINDKIETSKYVLGQNGLRQIRLESTSSNMYNQGKIKVFNKTLIFNYKFYFNKTRAF